MNKYISEKEYLSRMELIKANNISLKRKKELREESLKYRDKIKLPSTSKLMAVYLFIILNMVLIYAMVTMYQFHDLTYLGVLITDVAAQVLTYFIYAKKATAENTSADGTGIKFQAMMNEFLINHNDKMNDKVVEESLNNTKG